MTLARMMQFDPPSPELRGEIRQAYDKIVERTIEVPLSAYESYERGIQFAEQQFRIINLHPSSPSPCSWNHRGGPNNAAVSLDISNSRPLHVDARLILEVLGERQSLRTLELGTGAGISASAISRIPGVESVDGVSLIPVNPFLRFKEEYAFAQDEVVPHERLLDVFERVSTPYIRLQFVGEFPDSIILPSLSYDFVYESFGPLFHTYNSEHSRAIDASLDATTEHGTLFLMIHRKETVEFLLQAHPSLCLISIPGPTQEEQLLILKGNNSLAAIFSAEGIDTSPGLHELSAGELRRCLLNAKAKN